MKMAQIKLSPEELETSATKYASGSDEIQNVLNTLSQEQETIRSNWEGSGFESFDNQFTELKPKIQEFSELLSQINEQLRSVAQIMRDTDNDIAQAINNR